MKEVMVTTEKKGVFLGKIKEDNSPADVTLKDARMVVYWSSDAKGVLGIAVNGPGKGAKLTPAVKSIKIYGITAVIEMSDEAIKKSIGVIWS